MALAYREALKFMVSATDKETTFKTAIAVDQLLEMASGWTPFNDEAEKGSNAGMITGKEGPTATNLLKQWFAGELRFDRVHPNDLAFLLAYTLGPSTSAVFDTSGREHAFSASSNRTMPTFTAETDGFDSYQPVHSGCFLSRMDLSVAMGQWARASAGVIAAKKASGGSGDVSAVSGEVPCGDAGIHCSIGSSIDGSYVPVLGTPDLADDIVLKTLVRRFEMSIDNGINMEDLWTAEVSAAAPEMSRATRGPRRYTLSFDIEVGDDTYIDYLLNEEEFAVEFQHDSGVLCGATKNMGWALAYPDVVVERVSRAYGPNEQLMARVDCLVREDATLGSIQAAVWNDVTEYGAAVA